MFKIYLQIFQNVINTKQNKFPIQSVLYEVWVRSYSHYNAWECYELLNKIYKYNFDFILQENFGFQKFQLKKCRKILYRTQ